MKFSAENIQEKFYCQKKECHKVHNEIRRIAFFCNLQPDQFWINYINSYLFKHGKCIMNEQQRFVICPFISKNKQENYTDLNLESSNAYQQEYVFDATNEKCEKCQRVDGLVVTSVQMKNDAYMKSLGFWKQKDGVYRPHPNCKCMWISGFEKTYKDITTMLYGLRTIYNTKIPKIPRMTEHTGSWSTLVLMWFFEQGPNPIHFPESSPYSQDIAKSYSISKEIRDYYKKNKKLPSSWNFTGPKTATGNLGEVEWFIGSYSIQNVRYKEDGIHFTIYNCSSWHSGTRLPKSWSNEIKQKTGVKIEDLVSSAPRGEVLKRKVLKKIPAPLLKLKWVNDILNHLPSFGGNWEQYYDVVLRWEE